MKITRQQVEGIKLRTLTEDLFNKYVARYTQALEETKEGLEVIAGIDKIVQERDWRYCVKTDSSLFIERTLSNADYDMRQEGGIETSCYNFYKNEGAEVLTVHGREYKRPVLELRDPEVFRQSLQLAVKEHNRRLGYYIQDLEIVKSGVKVYCACFDAYSTGPSEYRIGEALQKLLSYILEEGVSVYYNRDTQEYKVTMPGKEPEVFENEIIPQKNNKLVIKF